MARILVIEDDDALRSVLRWALQRVGHVVFEAGDGRLGVEQVVRQELDLVITDILMPEQEGIETIQQIRRVRPTIPVIAMSGVASEGEFSVLQDELLMGASMTLAKPFDLSALVDAVDRLLKEPGERAQNGSA